MEINNRYFYFSIKKAEECLFSRRNGYQGILLFGYSFFFRIKRKFDLEKAEKKFHVDVIEPLSKKIQEEIDMQILEEVTNLAVQYKRYVEHWGNPIDPINYKLYSMETAIPCFHSDNRLFTIEEFQYQCFSNKAFREMWELNNMVQQPITPNESLEDFKMAVNKLSYVVNSVGINNSFDRTMARNCVDEVTIAFNTYIKSLTNE